MTMGVKDPMKKFDVHFHSGFLLLSLGIKPSLNGHNVYTCSGLPLLLQAEIMGA